jgi:hypothetical protein
MQTDLTDSVFGEGDDGEFFEKYVVVAVFKNNYGGGICTADADHTFKHGDYVGKLERTDNPFLPVSGVCCNRCVKSITHKKSIE